MRWTVLLLNAAVAAEVEALPSDMQVRLARYVEVIARQRAKDVT